MVQAQPASVRPEVHVPIVSSPPTCIGWWLHLQSSKVLFRMPSLPQSIWYPLPRFSPDIFNQIIDQSADNKGALQIFSGICRSWLIRCRHHLFSSIELNSIGSFSRYVDLVRTNPLLPSYTHSLRVRQASRAEDHTTWPTLVPVLLGRLLVALQELEFACPLPCPHPSFFTSVSQLQTVTSLSISGPIDVTFSGFVRMILSFPSLTHLRSNLDGIRGWKDPLVVPKRAMSQLHLSVLEIHDIDGHISEFVQWLLTTSTPASLTTLWFEFNDELELKPLGHLINRCESLRKLTLSLISGCPLSPIGAKFLSFRGNLCLDDLCYPEVGVGNLSSCLLNVLSTITRPSLRTLSIKLSSMDTIPFDEPADASFSAIGWEILDTALSAPVFANLRRVNLAYMLTPTMTLGTMSDSILAQKLPSLTSRRILDTRRTAYPNECMMRW